MATITNSGSKSEEISIKELAAHVSRILKEKDKAGDKIDLKKIDTHVEVQSLLRNFGKYPSILTSTDEIASAARLLNEDYEISIPEK